MVFRCLAATTVLAVSAACTEPGQDPIDDLAVGLSADRNIVALGDTVLLLATVFNPRSDTLVIGHYCGPSLDFRVTEPSGSTRSLLEGRVFICPLQDYHVLLPGETDTVSWKWPPAGLPGSYALRSAVRTSSGPRNFSDPVQVTVR